MKTAINKEIKLSTRITLMPNSILYDEISYNIIVNGKKALYVGGGEILVDFYLGEKISVAILKNKLEN